MSEETREPEVFRIGAHDVRIEEPDLTVFRLRGQISVDEARSMTEVERITWEGRERVYVFAHAHDVSLQPGVLLLGVDLYRDAPVRVVAVVGTSFSMRISLEMMVRSLRLLGKQLSVRTFHDEGSARAWLRSKRDRPSVVERKSAPEVR